MSSFVKKLPPVFLKNIEEVTYLVRGSQVIDGMEEFPFRVSICAEKHRRLSFSVKSGFLHVTEKEDDEDEEEEEEEIQPKDEDEDEDEEQVDPKEEEDEEDEDGVKEDEDDDKSKNEEQKEDEDDDKSKNEEQQKDIKQDDESANDNDDLFGPFEEEENEDKRKYNSEEDKNSSKKPKTHHDTDDDKTATKTMSSNQDSPPAAVTLADVNPADFYGNDGQTVVTNKSSPSPWRKVHSRPPSPIPTEFHQRWVIEKALDENWSMHDNGELAALISSKINDLKTQEDNNSISSTCTPPEPSFLLDKRPSSPDDFPCSPAYPPTEAVVDYPPNACNAGCL